MEISVKKEGDELIFSLNGRLDTTTSPLLQESFCKSFTGEKCVNMDFENLEYISSSGLRILLQALKKVQSLGGTLTISNINDAVMEVFEITGFKRIFKL